jgi:acetyltransferase
VSVEMMNASQTTARHLMSTKEGLECFFRPKTVAVIGATDKAGSVGRTVLLNLLQGTFAGKIYAVNPKRQELCGLTVHSKVGAIPEAVDLAIVVTPASTVPAVIAECVRAGVKACVVISAGFRENGHEGVKLEDQIREQLRGGGMRLIGPNCLGVMNPLLGLNATFAKDAPKAGNVAFLSQSGALLTAILDWSHQQKVGFSAIVSTGSMLDVGWGDLISHFGDDPHTHSILLYMESVGDARSLLSAVREVALSKPIIVIKAGRSEAASRAAASHTGALTGSDEVLDAAFRRSGVLRVRNIADLFYMADVLSKQVRPKGPRLTIITNAGGPAVLATDSLVWHGGELAVLSQGSLQALDEFLPGHWSHNNPIDVLGDADPGRYARALEIAAKDPNSDGLMVIVSPQGMTEPGRIAQTLGPYAKSTKPILASFMGGESVTPAKAALNALGIPLFSYPDTAAKVFCYMWQYTYNLRGLYETPMLAKGPDAATAQARASEIIDRVRSSGRKLLNEVESKQLLAAYDIPTVETRVATSVEEAVRAATGIGFPVVLKLFSETITHKTDVGGVKLDLKDETVVQRAFEEIKSSVSERAGVEHFAGVTVQPMVRLDGYELILGSSVDAQFGPVLLFGSGGQLVEVYRDRALALPPLNTTLAHRLMEETRVFTALKGVRGRKRVNVIELEKLLVRFSELVVEQPWISEIEINPLLASSDGLIALDARVVLHDPDSAADGLPKPAIRPYPSQYVWQSTTKNGASVTIRPIRPEDEPLMAKFHETLSDRTVYLRYFGSLSLRTRIAHERLVRICFGDYDRQMALVAEHVDATGNTDIIGVGRLSRLQGGGEEAEVAVLVSDQYQNQGLGTELLRRAIHVARAENIRAISGEMLPDNLAMQVILKRLGFQVHMQDGTGSVRGTLETSARADTPK